LPAKRTSESEPQFPANSNALPVDPHRGCPSADTVVPTTQRSCKAFLLVGPRQLFRSQKGLLSFLWLNWLAAAPVRGGPYCASLLTLRQAKGPNRVSAVVVDASANFGRETTRSVSLRCAGSRALKLERSHLRVMVAETKWHPLVGRCWYVAVGLLRQPFF